MIDRPMTDRIDRHPDPQWTPDSWRTFPARQMPDYPDAHRLRGVESQLSTP